MKSDERAMQELKVLGYAVEVVGYEFYGSKQTPVYQITGGGKALTTNSKKSLEDYANTLPKAPATEEIAPRKLETFAVDITKRRLSEISQGAVSPDVFPWHDKADSIVK